jgi:hypothetical protein
MLTISFAAVHQRARFLLNGAARVNAAQANKAHKNQ